VHLSRTEADLVNQDGRTGEAAAYFLGRVAEVGQSHRGQTLGTVALESSCRWVGLSNRPGSRGACSTDRINVVTKIGGADIFASFRLQPSYNQRGHYLPNLEKGQFVSSLLTRMLARPMFS